jgi:alanine racemase
VARAILTIDLGAIVANWRALDALSGPGTETAAVVKADAYGLGAARVGRALAEAGVRTFFVATAEEGAALREAVGPSPAILVLSGPMPGDAALCRGHDLVPVLNGPDQFRRHRAELGGHPCAVHLDLGMNRLGFEPAELARHAFELLALRPRLTIGHLSSSDEAASPLNPVQLATFAALSLALPGTRRSLSATGGTCLGPLYHFEMTRPGIGLYGGAPFAHGQPAVRLDLPVLQVRDVLPGESIGYGASFTTDRPLRAATVGAGYADGLPRALSNRGRLFAGTTPCRVLGRVSMDLMAVDVTGVDTVPETLEALGPNQGIDRLAADADTIAHDILTRLGSRYTRVYKDADRDADRDRRG